MNRFELCLAAALFVGIWASLALALVAMTH